jgi:hypothetical protein
LERGSSVNKAILVSPFDGGWCIKLAWTGEVLFFKSAAFAERRALKLAKEANSLLPGVEVVLHDRTGDVVGRWRDGGYYVQALAEADALVAA